MEWTAILALLAQVDWIAVFTIIVTILFVISEALANIPQVESNSIFQLARKAIKLLKDALSKTKNGKKPSKNDQSDAKTDENDDQEDEDEGEDEEETQGESRGKKEITKPV